MFDLTKSQSFQAIILAAGKGSRMGSDRPKVLLPLLGRPMISYICDILARSGVTRPVVVVGEGGIIRDILGDTCIYAVQSEQLGSGHAVMCAREVAAGSDDVIIMCGDSPLFRAETIQSMIEAHVRGEAAITLASAILDDPYGYGRILRDSNGEVCGVVEEKMATAEQKAVKEINGGCYAFDASWLWDNIESMRRNDAGEYCLTEMVDVAIDQGRRVITISAEPEEVAGVNTPDQLRAAEAILHRRRPVSEF